MTTFGEAPRSFTRGRSPDSSLGSPQRPVKRRRTWSDEVERKALANGVEDDKHRLAQRQKQIDFGKNTIAYDKFAAVLPREKRVKGDPMTPLAHQKCSKRSFAGQITSWKKRIYLFVDALEQKNANAPAPQTNSKAQTATKDAVDDSTDSTNGNLLDPGFQNNDCSADEAFSDIDDIQLDDFGNVISSETTDAAAKTEDCPENERREEAPPLIFDKF